MYLTKYVLLAVGIGQRPQDEHHTGCEEPVLDEPMRGRPGHPAQRPAWT